MRPPGRDGGGIVSLSEVGFIHPLARRKIAR
jgi:hypothetical protein